MISACYTNIAISVSFQRDTGVLKRINGTPLPSSAFLGARMVQALLVAILLVVITAGFGRAAYSASIPTGLTLLRFLVMLLVGAASFCALGFAVTAVIPNADAAPAIVNASILPLLFLSGVFMAGLDAAGQTGIRDLDLATAPLVLVTGSEGRGLSRIVAQACDVLVRIPIAAATESLNAGMATGIALYEVAAVRARSAAPS